MSRSSEYPKDRAGLFAFDLIKVLHRATAASEIGVGGVHLVSYVAIGEHREDYLAPPAFWNTELMRALAMNDEETFARLRKRCTVAGWLVYEKGTSPRAIGRYWAMIPPGIADQLLPRRNRGNVPGNQGGNQPGNQPGNGGGKDGGNPGGKSGGNQPGNGGGHVPGLSLPSTPALPTPTHPHPPKAPAGGGVGGGGGIGILLNQIDQDARIEAVLLELLCATGPKATPRWRTALKANRKITTMDHVFAALRWAVVSARAAGIEVNFASDCADYLRRWRPPEPIESAAAT